jgi:WhiB family redox-sensing transcriptional regulator
MGELMSAGGRARKGGTMTLEEWRRQPDYTPPAPSRGTRTAAEPVETLPDWRDQALCRIDKKPTSYFFPAEGDQYARIRIPAYCRRCEVAEECAVWAIAEGIPWGWFGGLSPQQRANRAHPVNINTNRPPRQHGFQRYRFGPWGKEPRNGCRCGTCTAAAKERWAAETARGAKRTGATR